MPEFYLSIFEGKQRGLRYELSQEATTIGRDPNNSISLRDIEVSRLHAKITRDPNDETLFKLVDLNSCNGIFVNGKKVSDVVLNPNDDIRMGRTHFVFEVGGQLDASNDEDENVLESGKTKGSIDPRRIPLEKRLDVFCNISQAISESDDLNQLLHRILSLIFTWTDADRGSILLVDQETQNYEVVSALDRNGPINDETMISRTVLDFVRQNEDAVLVNDVDLDSRWNQSKSVLFDGIHEAICVPIKYRQWLRGFIYVDNLVDMNEPMDSRSFNDEHVKLMSAIGQQTAVALENHLYYSQMIETKSLTAVGEAMTSLSHHIKNILQGISGAAHIVEDGLTSSDLEMTGHGWQIVKRNQAKITELVLDMLSFAKSNSLDLRVVDINALIEMALEALGPEIDAEGISIKWVPDPNLEMPMVEHKFISRALKNLIRNAIEACIERDDGVIEITTCQSKDKSEISVCVEDNGCGIEADDLQNVFSIFESSKDDRATGLGLPIAQRIAREHGGEITATSQVDVGSKFCLVFPLLSSDEPSTVMMAPPKSNSTSNGKSAKQSKKG